MRRDVYVYNEATGFVVTSRGLAGYDLSEIEAGSKEWREAVAEQTCSQTLRSMAVATLGEIRRPP